MLELENVLWKHHVVFGAASIIQTLRLSPAELAALSSPRPGEPESTAVSDILNLTFYLKTKRLDAEILGRPSLVLTNISRQLPLPRW